MGGISSSECVSIVLSYIGGNPLIQIPTTVVGGMPVAIRAGAIPSGLSDMALNAAKVGLQSGGLSAISKNPVAESIQAINTKITELSADGFVGLDSAVPTVSGNPNLAESYGRLKFALAGGDGKGGALSQLNKFKAHTDRLSGVTLPSTSLPEPSAGS